MKLLCCTFVVLILILIPREARADGKSDVAKLTRGILTLQPRLDRGTARTYAGYVRSAGRRYGVHPEVLIGIAFQESSFRTGLGEGDAGEHGICQIRKAWLSDPRFVREFPEAVEADLDRPDRSFTFAAFILSRLKARDSGDVFELPYWTRYNSGHFTHRLRYYQLVARHLVQLGYPAEMVGPVLARREIASESH